MRLLLLGLLLLFTTLFLGCSSDNNSSNNNGNSFTNSMDYEFTLTINGEVHKVKGNTTNGIPNVTSNGVAHYITNQCDVIETAGMKIVTLKINDVTGSNYISGQNLECQIILDNLLSGENQVKVNFLGTYFDTLSGSLGGYSSGSFASHGFSNFQIINGPSTSSSIRKLPLTITDLGTPSLNPSGWSPISPYNFGQTLKGNYNGTIYIGRYVNGVMTCDIPVQLSIDFKALRMY